MKISAVHMTALTLNFIYLFIFSRNLGVSLAFFQLPQHNTAHRQTNIVKYSFSKLEHKESFVHIYFDPLKIFV